MGLLLGGCGPASTASDPAAPSHTLSKAVEGAPHAAIESVEELERVGAALVAGGLRGLVRKGDGRFAAFVDAQPNRFVSSDAPFAERVDVVSRVQEVVRVTLKAYVAATPDDPTLLAEWAALFSLALRSTRVTWSTIDAFWAQLSDPDPDMLVRLEGSRALQSGTESMIEGALLVLSDPALDPAVRRAVTAVLAEHTRPLLRRLDAPQRVRIVEALFHLASRPSSADGAVLRRLAEGVDAPDVTLTARGVRVGETTLVPRQADGARGFDAAYKRSGPNDLLLVPLRDWTLAHREVLDGAVVVSVASEVTYRELVEVLFTFGQSEIGVFGVREEGSDRELWTQPPKLSSFGATEPPTPSLWLSMFVVGEGVALKTRAGSIAPGCENFGAGLAIPHAGGRVDEAALGACLARLKEQFPSDWSVTAVASANVSVGSVLDAISVARGTPEEPLFPRVFFGVGR